MVPPKKKRRVVPAPEADTAAMDTTGADGLKAGKTTSSSSTTKATIEPAVTSVQQISRKDDLTKRLIDQLDALESAEPPSASNNFDSIGHVDASISFLQLKSLQRSVLEQARRTQEVLKQQAQRRDTQELQLENLRYQQTIHQESQRRSDSAFEAISTDIAKLVRKSQGSTANNGKYSAVENNGNHETMRGDDAELLQGFLGADWKDPSRRSTIVAKLNQEVAIRKRLEDERKRLISDKRTKQAAVSSRERILKDLPSKLADMEKASLPLQRFCHRQSSSTPPLMKVTPKLGSTKRRSRLDAAKKLPTALYTVFHQLQSCLDLMEANTETAGGIAPEAMPVVEIEPLVEAPGRNDESGVVLKIPIPNIATGGNLTYRPKKLASISFRYDASNDVVLADCGNQYDMGPTVIDELFPGDRGEFRWTEEAKGTAPATEATTAAAVAARQNGLSYQWCNYLGGLHVAPRDQTAAKMHSSARVIVMALVRRVRATATLVWILHNLANNPKSFPRHAALSDADVHEGWATQLSSWAVVPSGSSIQTQTNHVGGEYGLRSKPNNPIRVYKAVLQTRTGGDASKQLALQVSVNLSRYPSVIPRWKILGSSSNNKKVNGGNTATKQEDSLVDLKSHPLPLYDEGLARLERHVNRNVDGLVVPSDQTTYDWVLAEQLIEVVKGWEDSLEL